MPPCAIAAKRDYGTILANVDWLHGTAESLLTITNLLIGAVQTPWHASVRASNYACEWHSAQFSYSSCHPAWHVEPALFRQLLCPLCTAWLQARTQHISDVFQLSMLPLDSEHSLPTTWRHASMFLDASKPPLDTARTASLDSAIQQWHLHTLISMTIQSLEGSTTDGLFSNWNVIIFHGYYHGGEVVVNPSRLD